MLNNKKLNDLHERIGKIEELGVQRVNQTLIPITQWKDREVIPISRWKTLLRQEGYDKAIDYFPDKYDFSPFGRYAPRDDDEQYDRWIADYQSLLIHTRNPEVGGKLCGYCILKHSTDANAITELRTSLRTALVSTFLHRIEAHAISQTRIVEAEQVENGSETNDKKTGCNNDRRNSDPNESREETNSETKVRKVEFTDPKPTHELSTGNTNNNDKVLDIGPIYPCVVINRFECPYKKCSTLNDDSLVQAGTYLELLLGAISFSQDITSEEMTRQYKVDFETESVHKNVPGFSAENIPMKIFLDEFRTTKVYIATVNDVANVLTDPFLIEKLLSQYFSHDEKGSGLISDGTKDRIINWFSDFKNELGAEELACILRQSTERSDKYEIGADNTDAKRRPTQSPPDVGCCICNYQYNNVVCLNCNAGVCGNHLFEHIEKRHHRIASQYLSRYIPVV